MSNSKTSDNRNFKIIFVSGRRIGKSEYNYVLINGKFGKRSLLGTHGADFSYKKMELDGFEVGLNSTDVI